MKSKIEKLGKVSITVEKDYWDENKTYNRLTIVERQGTHTAYLSRKVVPIGVDITDRNYWIIISKWADIPYEIVQEFGDSTELVISQKVVTLKVNELQGFINNINDMLGEGGSVDERIAAIKSELINGASEEGDTFKKIEDRLSDVEESVREGGSVDDRIEISVNIEKNRAQAEEELLREAYESLSQSLPVPKTAEEWAAMTSWEEGVIYRVAGTTSYTDYMYNGTTTIPMATYNNAIDDIPTAGSDNLVKSKGLFPTINAVNKSLLPISGRISIIGDSISTYAGTIPSGYVTQYPDSSRGVTSLYDMWWHLILSLTNSELEVNASWKGSRVTNTRQDTPDFYDRTNILGSPDCIFVALGTNDDSASVALGDYDYDSDSSELSESEFIPAYIKGIKELKSNYPDAKIVLFIFKMKYRYADAIRNIGNHYNLDVIDVRSYFVDNVHPSKAQMCTVAQTVSSFYIKGKADDTPCIESYNTVSSRGVANTTILLAKDLLNLDNNNSGCQIISPTGTFKGYLSDKGQWKNTTETSSFSTNYYQVKKGEILKIYHSSGTDSAKYGFFSQVPNVSLEPDYYVINLDGTSYDVIIVPNDGYITLSNTNSGNKSCYKLQNIQSLIEDISVFDISAKTNQNYETLNEALTDANNIIDVVNKKGGMSIKYIQLTAATYSIVKTEDVTELPTGAVLLEDASTIDTGTYNASQLSDFDTLPISVGSNVTYYYEVTEIIDEQDVTTYITWNITKITNDSTNYVQWRLMSTSWSTNVNDWQGVDEEPVSGSNNLAKSKDVFTIKGQVEHLKNLDDEIIIKELDFETRENTQYDPTNNTFGSNNKINCFIADIQGYDEVVFLVSHITTRGIGWGILNTNGDVIQYKDLYTGYTEGQELTVNLKELDSPKTLIVSYRKTLQSSQYCNAKKAITFPLNEKINELDNSISNIKNEFNFINLDSVIAICHQGRNAISCPSNSIHSITNAYMQGMKCVECDIKLTSDGIPVIMHDTTINATMQNIDGTPISGNIAIADYTLAELQANYVYKSTVAKYRTPITTLSEWIAKVKELSLIPLFHNLPISLLNIIITNFGNNFMYMGRDINTCKAIREAAPSCFIFFQYSIYEDDGTITNIPALINQMKDIKANAYSSLSYETFTDEFINALTENGFYWQLSSQSSYEPYAVERGCKFLLSDNWINHSLSYKGIYRMKDDLSNIDNVTENNGVAVLQNGSTSILPITSTFGSNIKIAITLSGTANISINNAIKNVGYDNDEETFVVGRNVITGDLTISITATSNINIRELCVFEA